jgi:hypothetical protein
MGDSPAAVLFGTDGNEKGTVANPLPTYPEGVSSGSWVPATPATYFGLMRGDKAPLLLGADGTLQTYSMVLTDAGSFRDDFPGTSLVTALAGTVTFTNGSTAVSGSACAFTTEVTRFDLIHLQGHAEGTYAVILNVVDDNNLVLAEAYAGADGTGTAEKSSWDPHTGSGGSISVSSSLCSLASGTTSGENTSITRGADYGPLEKTIRFSVSQRIANQTIRMGFADDFVNPNLEAAIELTGTDNTQITLVTRSDNTVNGVESVTVTLPNSLTTATLNSFIISVQNDKVVLWYDPADGSIRIFLAMCKVHIPPPYRSLLSGKIIVNTGVPAGSTTLSVDLSYLNDYNFVNTKEAASDAPDADAAAFSSVSAAVASTLLLAANKNRKQALFFNDSTSVCYLKFGTAASTTSYTVRIPAGGYFDLPLQRNAGGTPRPFNGVIYGYWAVATGAMRVTETT